jgi:hypothetical protein
MALFPPSMTLSFTQFMKICEVYDPDVQGRSQITTSGEGGRIQRKRKKTKPEIRRTKAVGGGKSEPVEYKDRKDIGQTNKQRAKSGREQQPTQERGSAKLSAKEAQRKAYLERKAREKGAKTKTADELLAVKKDKKKVNPNYKPSKPSGLTRQERMKVHRKAETFLRGVMKDQETSRYKKETGQDPDKKARTKIMGRVHKRMST